MACTQKKVDATYGASRYSHVCILLNKPFKGENVSQILNKPIKGENVSQILNKTIKGENVSQILNKLIKGENVSQILNKPIKGENVSQIYLFLNNTNFACAINICLKSGQSVKKGA